MICGLRAWARTASSPIATIMPVLATVVAGHSELAAIGIEANSADQPKIKRLSAYFATVWPTWAPTQEGARFSGGGTLTTGALSDWGGGGKAGRTTAQGPAHV